MEKSKKGKIIFIGCFILYVIIQPIFCAGEKEGTAAGIILKKEIGARQMGMGGAQTAIVDDVNALCYNPAGLASITHAEMSTMYLDGLADVIYGFMGYVQPLKTIPDSKLKNKEEKGRYGTLGIGVLALQGGEIEINYLDGTSEKKIVQADYLLTVGYGREIKKILLGINFKTIYTTLVEKYSAYAFALDVGGIYRFPYDKLKGLSLGVVLQNLGTEIKYEENGDPLPLTIKIGAAYKKRFNRMHYIQGAVDVLKSTDNQVRKNIGLEYVFNDRLAGRIGTRLGYDLGGMTYGLGIYMNKVKLDYAWIYGKDWDNRHLISLSFPFSGRPIKKEKKKRKIKREKSGKIMHEFSYGMDLFMKRKWIEAVKVWEGISEKDPKHKWALTCAQKTRKRLTTEVREYCNEAKQYYEKKEWGNAYQLWVKAWELSGREEKRAGEGIKKIKRNLKVMFDLGEKFYNRGKYGEALKEWIGINSKYPGYLKVKEKIESARIKIREMDNKEQKKIVNNIIAEAVNYNRKSKYSKAVEKLGQVLKIKPSHEKAVFYINKITQEYFKKGMVFYRKGEFSEAINCWGKIIKINPGDKKAKMWIKKAKKDFNKKVVIFYKKGINKYNEGDYIGAISFWKKGLRWVPEHKEMRRFAIEANLAQGILYYRENKLGGAIDFWKEVLRLDPKHQKVLSYLRRAKMKQKSLEELNKEINK